MFVCGKKACYFIIYTTKDIVILKIPFDPCNFFVQSVVNQLNFNHQQIMRKNLFTYCIHFITQKEFSTAFNLYSRWTTGFYLINLKKTSALAGVNEQLMIKSIFDKKIFSLFNTFQFSTRSFNKFSNREIRKIQCRGPVWVANIPKI